MSISHLIILGIVILLVVPPDKLPEIMRNLGRLVNDFKRQTSGIFSEVSDELKDVKSQITSDVKLTPDDMRKKIADKNSDVDLVNEDKDKKNEPI